MAFLFNFTKDLLVKQTTYNLINAAVKALRISVIHLRSIYLLKCLKESFIPKTYS